MNARPRALWGLALTLVVTAGGVATWAFVSGQPVLLGWRARDAGSSEGALEALGVYGEVPDLRLTERSGRPVGRVDLLGKVWIANCIYTHCKETCPIQTARLARLQPEFAGEPDLRLVSITVDPEHDTAAALRMYAERYDADPGLCLAGDKRTIYRLATEGFHLGVVDPDDHDRAASLLRWLEPTPAFARHGFKGLIMHSSRFVLVDRHARVRAYHLPEDESLGRLRRNVALLLRGRVTGPLSGRALGRTVTSTFGLWRVAAVLGSARLWTRSPAP
jgi:protein SCO1/2